MPTLNLKHSRPPFPRKKRVNSERKTERAEIYNSKEWKSLRRAYFQKNPLCERCLAMGKITAGQHVHHITSFMMYDDKLQRMQCAMDWNNLMTVCVDCHEILHGNIKKKRED